MSILPAIAFAVLFILSLSGNPIPMAAGTHPGISSLCATGSLSISSTNLLRSYDMETIRSSKAKDFSSAANDATASGGITIGAITGKFGKSTEFDGVNDALAGTAPTTPTSFTLAMYLYPRSSGGKIALTPSVVNNVYVSYGIISANKFTFANGVELVTSASTYSANAWHSVVITHSGTTITLRTDGTAATGSSLGIAAWTTLNIGNYNANNWFDGYIDELSIWSRVLTSDEILTYEAGPNGACSSPPAVSTVAASAITCASAILNGNLTSKGTSANVTVGFVFGLSPVLSGATNITVGTMTTTGVFSVNRTGLAGSTFYYVMAWANGTDGYAQGSILFFETTVCPVFCTADAGPVNVLILLVLLLVFGIFGAFSFLLNSIPFLLVGAIILTVTSFQVYAMTCVVVPALIVAVTGIAIMGESLRKIYDGGKK